MVQMRSVVEFTNIFIGTKSYLLSDTAEVNQAISVEDNYSSVDLSYDKGVLYTSRTEAGKYVYIYLIFSSTSI
jgi:hypothetical protein